MSAQVDIFGDDDEQPKKGFLAAHFRAHSQGEGEGDQNMAGPVHARAGANEFVEVKQVVKVPKRLVDLMTDDDAERCVQVWREAMWATRRTFDLATKQWIIEPDDKTRIAASQIFAAYREGLPVAKVEAMVVSFTDNTDDLYRIASTPSGRAGLLKAGLINEDWLRAKNLPCE